MPPLTEEKLIAVEHASQLSGASGLLDRHIEELIAACIPKLVGFLYRRYGSAIEAEDIAQEAVVRLLKRCSRGDSPPWAHSGRAVIGGLYFTAYHLALDSLNRAHNPELSWDMDTMVSKNDVSPEERLLRPQSIEELQNLYGDLLSDREWIVLTLTAAGDKINDIACRLGCSLNTVYVIRSRARSKLSHAVKRIRTG
jgi:RNA polymerase sigma factor (sigma-70 family)